jgi:ribosomal protein S1
MSDRYVKHPSELFKTGDIVEVRIKDVDVVKHRISLTRRGMGNKK